jgi:hypothetical protein
VTSDVAGTVRVAQICALGGNLVEPVAPSRSRGHDRRGTRRFVLWDRRSGFDRRKTRRGTPFGAALDSSLLYLRDRPSTLVSLLVLANVLSLLDVRLTIVALRMGAAEANPFMQYFFAAGAAQAAVVKCGIVAAASLGIWALRRRRPALMAALFFVAVYGAVVLYELLALARSI